MKTFIKRIALLIFLCSILMSLSSTVHANGEQDLIAFNAYIPYENSPVWSEGTVTFYGDYPALTFSINEVTITPLNLVSWNNLECEEDFCQADWLVELSEGEAGDTLHVEVIFDDGEIVTGDIVIDDFQPPCSADMCGG